MLALGGQPGEVMAVGSELIRIEVEGAGNLRESAQPPAEPVATPAKAAPQARIEVAAVSAPAVKPAPAQRPAPVAREANERPLASPAVRKRAWDAGIELRFVVGSGPAGRVLHDDLESYLAQDSRSPSAPASAAVRSGLWATFRNMAFGTATTTAAASEAHRHDQQERCTCF